MTSPARRTTRRRAALCMGILLAVASCAEDTGVEDGDSSVPAPAPDGTTDRDEESLDVASDTEVLPIELGLEVVLETIETNVLAARVVVEASEAVAVQIHAISGDHVVRTPWSAAVATSHVLPLVGLRADRDYDVRVSAAGQDATPIAEVVSSFRTGSVPDAVPDFEIVASPDRMSPGVTLIEPDPAGEEPGLLVALDHDGEVVWYHQSDETMSGVALDAAGTMLGTRFFDAFVEIDVLGTEVGRWRLPFEEQATPADVPAIILDIPWSVSPSGDVKIHTPHHEFTRLPDGNLIGLVRVNQSISVSDQQGFCPGDEQEWEIAGDLIIEFEPDGTVLRTWNLEDALDLFEFPGQFLCETETLFSTPVERDWTHANAVEYDPVNDLLLVSSRHTDHIVAFERGDTVGHQTEVAYVFGVGGDVEIDGAPFFHQHAPEVQADGSILVYDNGNFRPGGEKYSRAVRYEFDRGEDGVWRASQVWEHRVDTDDGTPLQALFLGDADALSNGNVLIAHGGIGQPGSAEVSARVIEVVPFGPAGGDVVMDIRFGEPETGNGITTYRAERIESFYAGPLWRS
ncbi:MAG: aryl-sulfate sulfotransferase [Ilumatobacter sp.]